MVEPIISFKDFGFQYDSQSEPTLKHINLDIFPGEKVLLAGPSGSGKSTLGRCINGLIPQSYPGEITGSATVAGHDIKDSSIFELSFSVGTVLQDPDSQFVGLSVKEDIAFSLENDERSQTEMRAATKKWAERLDLKPLLDHSPQGISGGQKQRVAMAGVLIDESNILLFDEPLASLDPASGKASIELIDHLARQQNLTVVIIEHRLEDVLQRPIDRLVVLKDGEIVGNDKPSAILKDSLMQQLGLREPLYLSALQLAGVKLADCENIDSVETVAGDNIESALQRWTAGVTLQEPALPTDPLLTLKNLNFSYNRNQPVIDGLNLTINRGDMLSLVGRNGTGKSTLSNLITGFLKLDGGAMKLEGQDLMQLSVKERADHIGYILQDPNQMISKAMIFDEVAAGLRLRGLTDEEVEHQVNGTLKVCGLYEFRHWPISALSFGQKKRVTIAAILVLNPEMIILDEPTAGQDLRHYTEMMNFLEKLNREQRVTIMLITHDMHLMLEYTQRAVVLADGGVLMDARPADVLTNEAVIEKAALAKTSLFTLAERYHLPSALDFVAKFVQTEREVRSHE
ncbi:ABC transporter ATP-binding protein [Furfurilactobacillus rossiae]|uniref:ABC transporter ATP-binding protein n=1 Tax=Furfurilactobacillus rossiae DSM 15814 TaxID=1114972 RepID=A0A0R1RIJ4_9LACO|nr:ABC transporter ATP-binding protein [Furfurilactobacillus rossiae]KRL55076.1 ABC transporter ATP-binding protein [Furfurilactobacillus rossiae DSM 15814]QFR67710.1 ATP-binding cassette domain-containing protein [Furfurilactobacillus rossiae]QLE60676.1 Duplicated ATPase component MtsB of energizing module of methionine-regulated ECF transporter [Furfurilactobacillus rossiae]